MTSMNSPNYELSSNHRHRDTCSVCCDEFKDAQTIFLLPCSHLYHEGCIEQWLKAKLNCPECRQFTLLKNVERVRFVAYRNRTLERFKNSSSGDGHHKTTLTLRLGLDCNDQELLELIKFVKAAKPEAETGERIFNLIAKGCYNITGKGLLTALTVLGTVAFDEVDLSGCCLVQDSEFIRILNMPCMKPLTSLKLCNCKVSDKVLRETIQNLTCLEDLDLFGCGSITDKAMETLQILTELKKLNLSYCSKITALGLEYLQALSSLRDLNVSHNYNSITDSCLQGISKMSKLDHLNLSWCKEITDEGLKLIISRLKNLQYLSLYGCLRITDHGLSDIRSLTELSTIHLAHCQISKDTLQTLKACDITDPCAL